MVHPENTRERDDSGAILRRVRTGLTVLRKRKWTVIAINVLVLAMALAYTSRQTPVYRATATLIIDRSPPRLLSDVQEIIELGSSNYWAIKDYLRTQYEIIRSREVAERVVDRMNLRGDERVASAGAALPGGRGGQTAAANPVDVVLSKIRVEPLVDSMMVYVHAEDKDPHFARDLANSVAEAYRDHNLDSKKRIVLEAQKDLDKLVSRLRSDKDKAESDLAAFEREHNLGSLENHERIIDQRIQDYSAKLNSVSIRRLEIEAKLGQLRRYKSGRNVFTVAYASVLDDPLIVSMKQRYVQLQDQLAELQVTYLDKHPKVLAIGEQMKQIKAQIQREIANQLQAVEDEYREIVATEAALQQKLEEAKVGERELSRIKESYRPLVQRRDEAVKYYEEVLRRKTEATLTAQSTMNNVRVHDIAVEPISPVRPNWRLAAAVALLLGLIGGVGFAFLRELLDNTVKTRADIEEVDGLSFLGVMPTMGAESKAAKRYHSYARDGESEGDPIVHPALYIHYRKKSVVAERTRNIRTNLVFMMPERPLRTVLVTSPNPEEGKTTVSVNIAIAMAQGGSRTLLVDTDLRRPRVHKCFGLENRTGMSSAVISSEPLASYITSTEVPNLDLLLSGPVPPDPTALLHTERFRQIMAELEGRYDVVILDSPPVLPVTDAMIIANHADGVVLVVKSDKTTREAMAMAWQELRQVNANILGSVLNDHDVARKGYGHYTYYRHRYYNAAENTDGTSAARSG